MSVHKSETVVHDASPRFPIRRSELDRFKLGKKWYYQVASLKKSKTLFSLDVGCGAKPFPKADVLCDLCLKPVPDRRMKALATGGKPFVLCDCNHLPFRDEAFDFVTSYYLLEHVNDPGVLFLELKRVSKHGFVQCPSWFNELVYGEKVHKWAILERDGRLYVKPLRKDGRLRLGFVSHILYQSCKWQILHAVLDELFHVFSVQYVF